MLETFGYLHSEKVNKFTSLCPDWVKYKFLSEPLDKMAQLMSRIRELENGPNIILKSQSSFGGNSDFRSDNTEKKYIKLEEGSNLKEK